MGYREGHSEWHHRGILCKIHSLNLIGQIPEKLGILYLGIFYLGRWQFSLKCHERQRLRNHHRMRRLRRGKATGIQDRILALVWVVITISHRLAGLNSTFTSYSLF